MYLISVIFNCFLIFCGWSNLLTPRPPSILLKSDFMLNNSSLVNLYNWCAINIQKASNWNLEITGPLHVLHFSAYIQWASESWPLLSEHQTQLNKPWMQVHMNAFEQRWTSLNAIECAWTLSECELPLNSIECMWRSLSIYEHPLNAIEGTWTPWNKCEHLNVIDYWLHVNACKWRFSALAIQKEHFWLL